jgi:hypothetical protein
VDGGHVPLTVALLGEGLLAVFAGEGANAGVRAEMVSQIATFLEHFFAVGCPAPK